MQDLANQIIARISPDVEILTGQIAQVLSASVTVYIGGNLHPDKLVAAPGYKPVAGDQVLVLRRGQVLTVLGAITPPYATEGTVSTVPGSTSTVIGVTVAGIAAAVELPFLDSYTPVVGHQVSLLWRGGVNSGLVLGKVGNALPPPAPPAPPPPPPPAPLEGSTVFNAVDVGTYRSGWRNDDNGDVIQGTAPSFAGANSGAWFYGGHPKNTLTGATVTALEIWLGRTSGGVFGGQSCHLYRVVDDWQPGGALTFGTGPNNVSLSVGQEGWFSLPASLGQELVNSGGSIGITGEPYMRMYGLSKSGQAGTIRIYWRR